MKLYVGNLSYSTDENELRQLFGQHGVITSAAVINDRETGRSKGFGFIEFGSDQEGHAAIQAMDGKELGGRALKVNEAKPRENSGGGYAGGRGGSFGSSGGGGRRY